MPLAGILVQYTGWSSVFYVYGESLSLSFSLSERTLFKTTQTEERESIQSLPNEIPGQ